MDDLIAREDVYKAFEDVLDEDFPYKSEVTPRERIENIQSAQQWILCYESMPEENVNVLVYDSLDFFVAWHNENGWGSFDDNFDEYTPIIAWMPIPERL